MIDKELCKMYKRMFLDSPEGQKIYEDLKNKFDKPSFYINKNGPCPDSEMAWREGRRRVVLYIEDYLKYEIKE